MSKNDAESNEWSPEILKQANDNRAAREEVKLKYPELFTEIQKCLFEHDPMAINFETNTDEYDPEVGTIIPRLSSCKSQADVQTVIHEEFVKWFGAENAGNISDYENIAKDVWNLWNKTQQTN
ncbi:hypothetical protein [Desulfosarcina cetonica]|uniref:hypothetical protein n=1 Tax=Desulfosarcina cetonica TaxID=90730 RepID=UPI000A4A05E4|nr:hypothetical protein [Desulfosarcina cetonica]